MILAYAQVFVCQKGGEKEQGQVSTIKRPFHSEQTGLLAGK